MNCMTNTSVCKRTQQCSKAELKLQFTTQQTLTCFASSYASTETHSYLWCYQHKNIHKLHASALLLIYKPNWSYTNIHRLYESNDNNN